jgi:hypothetical protein
VASEAVEGASGAEVAEAVAVVLAAGVAALVAEDVARLERQASESALPFMRCSASMTWTIGDRPTRWQEMAWAMMAEGERYKRTHVI